MIVDDKKTNNSPYCFVMFFFGKEIVEMIGYYSFCSIRFLNNFEKFFCHGGLKRAKISAPRTAPRRFTIRSFRFTFGEKKKNERR